MSKINFIDAMFVIALKLSNLMIDQSDDSNKWSNEEFNEYIRILGTKIRTLS